MRCQEVNVKYCGKLKAYVQGEGRSGKVAFLTVHDVGSNHNKFIPFVEMDLMKDVAKKSVWIHVCLPGQDDNDVALEDSYEFPTLDEIAEDIKSIMDQHHIPTIIGFGEGAGANVLCRFGLLYPNRCTGLVLIDCTANSVTVEEKIQSTLMMANEGVARLVGKFRSFVKHTKLDNKSTTNAIQQKNFMKYLQSYMRRDDISQILGNKLKSNLVLVTGDNSKNLNNVRSMSNANVNRILLVILENSVDPLIDSPVELARALILFCKGCGVLIGVPMIGLEKEFKEVKDKKGPTETQLQISRQIQMYEQLLEDELHCP